MSTAADQLTAQQRAVVDACLPGWVVVHDHSWGLVDTVVLEVVRGDDRCIVKTYGPGSGNLARELRAHREWTGVWVRTGRAPELLVGDEEARLLLTRYLPGHLVQGIPAEHDPDTYRQAGALLAAFHGQCSAVADDWDARLRARVERWLAEPHRIAPSVVDQIRAEVADWPTGGARVVPTHGDWQPRNWLVHDGEVRVIDFGRADLRPPEEDLLRLARQEFWRDPALETAFFEGYGADPRAPGLWRRSNVAEAVGTATWAYAVGDEPFEALGHEHLARLYPEG